jgi:hypothetical protein
MLALARWWDPRNWFGWVARWRVDGEGVTWSVEGDDVSCIMRLVLYWK